MLKPIDSFYVSTVGPGPLDFWEMLWTSAQFSQYYIRIYVEMGGVWGLIALHPARQNISRAPKVIK